MADRGVDRPGRREVRWRLWQQLPLLIALVALWALLWGEFSALSILSGLVVAIVVTLVFYLPPVELTGRFNPLWFLAFLGYFAVELAAGSVLVAAKAFAPTIRRSAIIEVPLRTSSDVTITMTATVVSLIPGTLVLEIDRERAILFLHVLGTDTPDRIERARRSALRSEVWLVRAIGSRADLERIRG